MSATRRPTQLIPAWAIRQATGLVAVARAIAFIGGGVLVAAGMVELRRPSDTPVPVAWLQGVLSPVFANPRSISQGTLTICAGAILFSIGVRTLPIAPAGASPESVEHPAPLRMYVPLALAVGLYAAVLARTLSEPADLVTGGLFLGALAACTATVFSRCRRRARLFERRELVLLTLAALVAIAVYVHDAAYWFYTWVGDEWAFFNLAQYLASGKQMNVFQQAGVYDAHPVMDSLFQASTLRILGSTVTAWRASCAIATAAAALPLYVLTRLVVSRLAAVIAVGLYLCSHTLMAYAHIGYNQPDALVPFVAALAFFVAGRVYDAPRYLFLAGVAAGVGWYTFYTGRAAIVLILLGLLIDRPRSLGDAALDGGLLLAGFALVLIPFVIVNGTSIISVMLAQNNMTPSAPSLPDRLSQNGIRVVFGFVYSPQTDGHYVGGALFDSVSAFFWILGTAVLLKRRTVWSAMILTWYWILVIPLGGLYYALHLNTSRMYILVPLACVIAGAGAASVFDTIGSVTPAGARRPVVSLATAAVVAAAGASNLYVFYHVTPATMGATPEDLAMKVIQDHPSTRFIIAPDITRQGFPSLEAYGLTGRVVEASSALTPSLIGHRARPMSTIVLSAVSLTPLSPDARQHIVWDSPHRGHIVETDLRP